MLNIGGVMFGFHVDSITDVPDVNGRLWRMTYEKNGAELVWLERDDDVKTFVIAFKTLPEDDTGVAHILEHSVLAGSEKYPVKSPFDELRKSSLRVFMNAMTARDKTYYPFSTRNDQDFMNLADVYLDAVFHPLAVKSPLAFQQEGWHYEIDSKTEALRYNGVVYNEMKGVFADPERIASREVLNCLYPDIVYGHDSGGKPGSIPNLTFTQFSAFYRKFYHPTNARIFLDGRVNVPAILKKLDACLGDFDRAEKIGDIPMQRAVSAREKIHYASSDLDRKTILADAWSVGLFRDLVSQAALDVLVEYLAGSNEAPLKKALLGSGLCDDVQLHWYDYQQLSLVMIIRNTSDAQAERCRQIAKETIEKLLDEGLDHTRILAIINKNEFDEREINSSRPRGLSYFSRAIKTWLYDGDPAAAFDITGIYAKLREDVGAGLLEACLRKMVLVNKHHVELTVSPSQTAGEDEFRRVAAELAQRRARLSSVEFAALKHDIAELTAYQSREDTDSAKATIPALHISDIPRTGRIIEHSIVTKGSVTTIKTRPTCDGVVYATLYFPVDGLGVEELLLVPLCARLQGKMPTARHDALTLQTEISSKIGRLTFSTIAAERGNYLCVKIAVLAENDLEAVQLLQEVLRETRFEDVRAIEKIHRQAVIAAEREVMSRGDDLAESYAAKGVSRQWASRDILHGYGQLRWLQHVSVSAELAGRMAELARRIFVQDGLILSHTDNLSAKSEAMLDKLVPASDGHLTVKSDIPCRAGHLAAIKIDGDTGYSSTVTALPVGCDFHGAMRVAAKILSLGPLHRQIREAGGAYGTAMSILPSGLISSYTYRDPTPISSLATMRNVGGALESFARSGTGLDRFIVATVAGIDPYLPPASEASRPAELHLALRSPSDEGRSREQVLETSPDDLERIAVMLNEQMQKACSLVVGGSRQTTGLQDVRIEAMRMK